MSKSGRWSQQVVFKNCGKKTCLQGCPLNKETKPHGPYAQIRRRNPDEIGKQDLVYLGKRPLTAVQLEMVNEVFRGPSVPTKTEVYLVVENRDLERKI